MAFFQKKNDDEPEEVSVERELKRNKMFGIRDLIWCIIIVVVFLMFKDKLSGGTLRPNFEETQFGVIDLDGVEHSFVYADAESIELRTDLKRFDRGEQLSGQETWNCWSGEYRNGEYGEYQLYVQRRLHNFIVVRNDDGILAFNIESDDTTKQLYEYIMEQRGTPVQ